MLKTAIWDYESIAIILAGKRELVALLYLSSWCLVLVEPLFLAVPQGCLRFVIVVFPDHTHLLFSSTVTNLFISQIDSTCIHQSKCKVLKIFQCGNYLVANVLK